MTEHIVQDPGRPVSEPSIDLLLNFVLDKSGSMMTCWHATISAFNEFVGDQKQQPGKTWMSLTLFDTVFDHRYSGLEISTIPDLSTASYSPGGNTALYDAIAHAIKQAEGEAVSRRPDKVLTVILTDGQENSSHEFVRSTLFKLIEAKQTEGWDFIYLGANQDAYVESGAIGIPAGHTSGYTSSAAGMQSSGAALAASVSNYRQDVAVGTANPDFFAGHKDAEGQIPEHLDLHGPQPQPQAPPKRRKGFDRKDISSL